MTSLDVVFANSKIYEDIQERRTQGFADIERALDIVREFLIRKKRILYGGMSIDISLKLSGHPGIYAEDAVPDYDFYSPDIEGDSDEIAKILYDAGFEGVFAQNAQHATTRRVKINFANNVADVSYMPQEIYDRIPTQMYKGMRVTHPIFQWMDMHRALSQPFEKPPWEVISHRVYKDIKRYRMMYDEYGVPYKEDMPARFGKDSNESTHIDWRPKMSFMMGGYQAYAVLHSFLHFMIDEKSLFHKVLDDTGTLAGIRELFDKSALAMMRANSGTMRFEFPADKSVAAAHSRINIITDDFPDAAKAAAKAAGAGEPRYYEMYGDFLRPRTIVVPSRDANGTDIELEIFDNFGHIQPGYPLKEVLTVLHKINPDSSKQISLKSLPDIWLTGPQNVLLYALQKYHDYNTPEDEREYHLYMYQSGIWLIEAAERVINTLRNASSVEQEGLQDLYKKLPFFLTTQSYGSENWSADYLSMIYHKTYLVEGVSAKDQVRTRPIHFFYPDRPHEEPAYDISSSFVFQMSGKRVPGPFKKTSNYPTN